jgi:hypothetical protein
MRSTFGISALALVTLLSSDAFALPKLLLFTKVSPGAYTHLSIPTAVDVITRLGEGTLALNDTVADPSFANSDPKWTIDQSDDDSLWVNASYLNQYDAVCFVMTE